jgi:ferric-dicitrate binding protein FerR (iron transport regulator)
MWSDLRAAFGSLERHAPVAEKVLARAQARSRQRRRMRIGGLATVAAAAATAVVVSLLPGGPAAPGGTASQRHGQAPPVTTLRAKLLAAFESAGGQIMYERTTGYSDGGGAGTENWFYPWERGSGSRCGAGQWS